MARAQGRAGDRVRRPWQRDRQPDGQQPEFQCGGSQDASGAGASVIGDPSAHAGHDAVASGHDSAVPAAEQPAKKGWWARLLERGAVVAFSAVVTAVAAVAIVVVTIMIAAGWKP